MDAQLHTLNILSKRFGLAFKVCAPACNKRKTADIYLEISAKEVMGVVVQTAADNIMDRMRRLVRLLETQVLKDLTIQKATTRILTALMSKEKILSFKTSLAEQDTVESEAVWLSKMPSGPPIRPVLVIMNAQLDTCHALIALHKTILKWQNIWYAGPRIKLLLITVRSLALLLT